MWSVGVQLISNAQLSASSFASLSSFHCSVTAIAIVGMLLVVFNDDVSAGSIRWSWISHELLPPRKAPLYSKDIEKTWKGALNDVPIFYSVYLLWLEAVAAAMHGQLLVLLMKWYSDVKSYLSIRWDIYRMSRMAESKLHLMYLIEKRFLNLSIVKGESLKQSYLDAKLYMKEKNKWPFMWSVKNVRDEKIDCLGRKAMPFSSYSYLGMVRDESVQEAAIAAAKLYSTGGHGPRMLGGGAEILRELEKVVGKFFGREDSLVLSGGYLACMSGVCAVASKGDLCVYDSRVHASLQAGLKLCGATIALFRHNDFEHCEKLLKKNRHKYRNCWIVIESVYSMDGDIANLPAAYGLKKKYNAQILLDEAHGLGVLGKTGRGLEEHCGLPNVCDLIVGTFSKSAAGIGGYITGSKQMVDYLDFHCPGNLFSAPLTAYSAGGIIRSLTIIMENPSKVQKLHENIRYLRKILNSSNLWPAEYPDANKFQIGGCDWTSVIPVIYPNDMDRVFRVGAAMLDLGYMVSAVGYPACPFNTPRLRITATSDLEKEDMDNFLIALVKATIETVPSEEKLLL